MENTKSKRENNGAAAEPIALTVVEAAKLSGTSRSTIYEALQRRELEGKKLGRRTLILRDALNRYLSSLPAFGDEGGDGSTANG